jgi:hypothetical protein
MDGGLNVAEIDRDSPGFIALTRPPVRVDPRLGPITLAVVGVLFVAADNLRSLHTTTNKLGRSPWRNSSPPGRRYHFPAHQHHSRDHGRIRT